VIRCRRISKGTIECRLALKPEAAPVYALGWTQQQKKGIAGLSAQFRIEFSRMENVGN